MQHALNLDAPAPASAPIPLPFADYSEPTAPWNHITLVGEAPGAEEARQGRPFVGRSGQLLDKMLHQSGIDRAACLVANVFRYQPPGNKVDHFFISKRAAAQQGLAILTEYGPFGSAWCRADYGTELAHLQATLQSRRPKIVLALGRTPFWALTGESGLLEKAGHPRPCRLTPGPDPIPVIPTFHPSFILRGNWALEPQWLSHFALAAKLAEK